MDHLKASVHVLEKLAEVALVEAMTAREYQAMTAGEYQAQQGTGGATGVEDNGFKPNEGGSVYGGDAIVLEHVSNREINTPPCIMLYVAHLVSSPPRQALQPRVIQASNLTLHIYFPPFSTYPSSSSTSTSLSPAPHISSNTPLPKKMSLSSEIITLLTHLNGTVGHVTSPGQHELLSPEERKAVMDHVSATVEVLAQLAEVAHVEALTAHGGMENVGDDDVAQFRQRIRAATDEEGEGAERSARKGKSKPKGEQARRSEETLSAFLGVLFNSLECSNFFGKEQGLGVSLIEAAFMDASDRKINTCQTSSPPKPRHKTPPPPPPPPPLHHIFRTTIANLSYKNDASRSSHCSATPPTVASTARRALQVSPSAARCDSRSRGDARRGCARRNADRRCGV
ncbi:uncharacterized protein LAJ45_10316 [Morchella importuna]|uniref:uncharacterized protein n=1 Tax=Morchella importuna TaxID=1174673 RepID=UPI001E8CA722|nr:uncharacterized protein LAJ45_10316 [Morchella importuna]KAH8145676.1 hypothetical protein LAJ45_10316 [Morchella importuna]